MSGVCLDADGVCADASQVIYVASSGADTGACTSGSPCETMAYAYTKAVGGRTIIKLISQTLAEPTLTVTSSLIIDGSGGPVLKPAGAPTFQVSLPGSLVLEDLVLAGSASTNDPALVVNASAGVRIFGGELQGGVSVAGGTASVRSARIDAAIDCSNGSIELGQSFSRATVSAQNCQVTVDRSRFEKTQDTLLTVTGGTARISNSIFAQGFELADSLYIHGVTSSSFFEHNTVVNTAGIDSDGTALDCDSSLLVRNNVFAYRSRHPHGYQPGCQSRSSLYDSVATSFPTVPLQAHTGAITDFFANLGAKDFHLSVNSPAKGKGDPSSPITSDFEGGSRPNPTGSAPDVGAYEAP